jgi:hypothetical protein
MSSIVMVTLIYHRYKPLDPNCGQFVGFGVITALTVMKSVIAIYDISPFSQLKVVIQDHFTSFFRVQ